MTQHRNRDNSLDDVISELASPQPFDVVRDSELAFDCIIGISGFEPRCLAAARELERRRIQATSSICVQYSHPDMAQSNSLHLRELMSALERLTAGRTPLCLGHNDHNLDEDFGDRLLAALTGAGVSLTGGARVGFDITVGSSRLLLEGLHALLSSNVNVTLMYSEASEYRPLFTEYLEHMQEPEPPGALPPEFLTSGVDQVEVLRRLPGMSADARPTYLVAFPSFSLTRMGAVFEELSPSRIQWMFGIPHLVQNRWRLDAQKEYHASLIEHSHRHCYVSTFDYRESLYALEEIFRKRRSQYSVLIASLGSKLQKVGQALFHIVRPEVGAVVSIPQKWDPDRFSSAMPRGVRLDPRRLRRA